MIKKLYFEDSYTRSFDAEIINIEKNGNDFDVELDATYFYPSSGGQIHDLGYIDGIPLIDVFIQGDKIIHRLTNSPGSKKVKCEIDFERRYDFMQQHSGQHLLTSVLESGFEYKTLSSQLGEEHSTIELDTPGISEEQIYTAEHEVLKIISEAVPIKSYFVKKEELKEISIRKMVDIDEEIRIVEIDGKDFSMCGGTHLKNTSEINLVKIIGSEKIRGNTRLFFLCGKRAFRNYQQINNLLENIKKTLGVPDQEIQKKVENLISGNKNLYKEIGNLYITIFEYEISTLDRERKNGYLVKTKIFENVDRSTVQQYAKKLSELEKSIGIIALKTIDNIYLFFVSSKDVSIDMSVELREFVSGYGGKGGGSPFFAQGGIPFIKEIDQLLYALKDKIHGYLKNA